MKRTHVRASAVLVAAMVIATFAASGESSAYAAATTRLVSASSVVETVGLVRNISHPGAMSSAVVVSASDPVALTQAAAFANQTGAGLIATNSTTDPASTNAIISSKNVTKVTLVGVASAFPSTFRSALDPRVVEKKLVLSNSVFIRSRLLVPANVTSFVVAKASDLEATTAALSLSSATDSALVLVTGSESAGAIRQYFDTKLNPTMAVVGDLGIPDQISADDYDRYAEFLLRTPQQVDSAYGEIIQQHVDRKGRAANKISTAPSGDLISFALATIVGKAEGSVTIPAGTRQAITNDSAVDRYGKLWSAELKSLSLVGAGLSPANLTSVAQSSSVPRQGQPAWTVTNAVLGAGSHVITFTARQGASRYDAIDWEGNVLASTTSTSITLANVPAYATIVAYDPAGVELERIFFRSTAYDVAADRNNAVIGTIRNGTAHIKILGTPGIPRKIVRFHVDPYKLGDPASSPVTVAMTCGDTFTETGLDQKLQWVYEVVNVTGKTGSGCGSQAGVGSGESALPVSVLTLPVTEDPFAQGIAAEPQDPNALIPQPGQTLGDVARQRLEAESLNQGNDLAMASVVGNGMAFSYQAYIPEMVVPFPFYSGDPSKPYVYFNGSGRSVWEMNSIHNKFDIRAYVRGGQVAITKHMGETRRYHCGPNPQRVLEAICVLADRKTAPLSQLSGSGAVSDGRTVINFAASAANPLQDFSPPIDGRMEATLTPYAWTLRGVHDRMPVHQFYYGWENSDAYLAYSSDDFYFLGCLFGGSFCTANVNVRF